MEDRTRRDGAAHVFSREAQPSATQIRGKQSISESNAMLVSPMSGPTIELHADVWLQANSPARLGFVRAEKLEDAEGDAAVPLGQGISDFFVSVVMPDAGAGGLVTGDETWLARLDPAAQRTLRAESWNDVRLRLADGRVTVRLNGWPACDVGVSGGTRGARGYCCALAAPDDGSEGRWRYVRTRVLHGGAAPSVEVEDDITSRSDPPPPPPS